MLNKTILGVAVTAAAVLLAACGSGNTGGTSASAPASASSAASSTASSGAQSGTHNQADVTFVQQMIPHHQQAVDMAELAATRAASTQVKDLASRIESEQSPEIQEMTAWLAQWGVPSAAAAPSMSAMPGMSGGSMPGMSGGSMPGMMSDADMTKLTQASGTAFDRMFLQMMITHHQGAVAAARTEVATGSSAEAKALAQSIITGQTAEVTQMQQLLTSM
jgi:uncharacterized protein (DUF305 family)